MEAPGFHGGHSSRASPLSSWLWAGGVEKVGHALGHIAVDPGRSGGDFGKETTFAEAADWAGCAQAAAAVSAAAPGPGSEDQHGPQRETGLGDNPQDPGWSPALRPSDQHFPFRCSHPSGGSVLSSSGASEEVLRFARVCSWLHPALPACTPPCLPVLAVVPAEPPLRRASRARVTAPVDAGGLCPPTGRDGSFHGNPRWTWGRESMGHTPLHPVATDSASSVLPWAGGTAVHTQRVAGAVWRVPLPPGAR